MISFVSTCSEYNIIDKLSHGNKNKGVADWGLLSYSYNLVSEVFVLVRRISHIFHSVEKLTYVAIPTSTT